MSTAAPHPDSVELFVRSLSPTEKPVGTHVDRVRDLSSAERIETASIRIWGTRVGLSTTARRTDAGRTILDRVAEFRSWADSSDVTMEPFFESRSVTSSVTGEEYTALRLPVSCLAEYVGGELVHVAPYSTGDAICTVADRIGKLEAASAESTVDAGARLQGLQSR